MCRLMVKNVYSLQFVSWFLISVLLAELVATVAVDVAAVVIQTVIAAVLLPVVIGMVPHPPLSQGAALPGVKATKADAVSTVGLIP